MHVVDRRIFQYDGRVLNGGPRNQLASSCRGVRKIIYLFMNANVWWRTCTPLAKHALFACEKTNQHNDSTNEIECPGLVKHFLPQKQ